MKIYCILLDACPYLDEFDQIIEKNNLTRLDCVSQPWTTPTLFSMFTGKLPSDLIKKGVGYYTSGNRMNKWRKKNKTHLFDILRKNGYKIIGNNRVEYFVRNFLFLEKSWIKNFRSIKNPKQYLEDLKVPEDIELYSSNPLGKDNFLGFSDEHLTQKFYENEKKRIEDIQSKKGDFFVFQQTLHWSAFAYYNYWKKIKKEDVANYLEKWFGFWDFDEPDSVFWIFQDHSDDVTYKNYPWGHHTWVMYKDNTNNKLNPKTPVVSSLDFYSTILKKIGVNSKSPYSQPIDTPFDKNRIYYNEDSRSIRCPFTAENASAMKLNYDKDELIEFKQLTFNEGDLEKYVYSFDQNESPDTLNELDYDSSIPWIQELKKYLLMRIKWVNKKTFHGEVSFRYKKISQFFSLKIYLFLYKINYSKLPKRILDEITAYHNSK